MQLEPVQTVKHDLFALISDNRQILGDIDGIDVILQQLAVSRKMFPLLIYNVRVLRLTTHNRHCQMKNA